MEEIRVYVANANELPEEENFRDAVKKVAKLKGRVYTLQQFQRAFNNSNEITPEINSEMDFIVIE